MAPRGGPAQVSEQSLQSVEVFAIVLYMHNQTKTIYLIRIIRQNRRRASYLKAYRAAKAHTADNFGKDCRGKITTTDHKEFARTFATREAAETFRLSVAGYFGGSWDVIEKEVA